MSSAQLMRPCREICSVVANKTEMTFESVRYQLVVMAAPALDQNPKFLSRSRPPLSQALTEKLSGEASISAVPPGLARSFQRARSSQCAACADPAAGSGQPSPQAGYTHPSFRDSCVCGPFGFGDNRTGVLPCQSRHRINHQLMRPKPCRLITRHPYP